ncbi:MAG: YdcF family protein [Niabella sp.]
MFKLLTLVLLCLLMLMLLGGCISYRKRPTKLYQNVLQFGKTFDAGVVPGYPYDGNQWDTVMKGRVLWAYHLYKQGIIRNIIFSGSAVYTPYYESKIMGLYARQLGIPAEHIFYDTLAEHSTENIFYSYQLAKQRGFKSLALVTDPFQSSLTKRFTKRRFGTDIYHLPFMVDTIRKLNYIKLAIDDTTAFKQDFQSIKEREGWFKRLRGTMGAFIPWENKREKAEPL